MPSAGRGRGPYLSRTQTVARIGRTSWAVESESRILSGTLQDEYDDRTERLTPSTSCSRTVHLGGRSWAAHGAQAAKSAMLARVAAREATTFPIGERIAAIRSSARYVRLTRAARIRLSALNAEIERK